MRLFGSDRIARWMDKGGAEEGEVISHPWVTGAISQAQKRVELQNFQARKRLLEYDDVMNQQREVVYSLRLFALERGEQIKAEATRMVDGAVERVVTTMLADAKNPQEFDRTGVQSALTMQFLVSADDLLDPAKAPDLNGMVAAARAEGHRTLTRKVEYLTEFGKSIGQPDVDMQVLSAVMLRVLDEKWKDHLYDLDQLRNAIQYRAYGQKDPLVEYKKEAFEMFEDLMRDVQATFTEQFLKIQVSAEAPRQAEPPPPGAFGGRRAPVPRTPPPRAPATKPEEPTGADRAVRARGKGGGGADSKSRCPSDAVNQSWADACRLYRSRSRSWSERSLSLRVGQEVQEVSRSGTVGDFRLKIAD